MFICVFKCFKMVILDDCWVILPGEGGGGTHMHGRCTHAWNMVLKYTSNHISVMVQEFLEGVYGIFLQIWSFYSQIAFYERVIYWLQRVRSQPCACVFVDFLYLGSGIAIMQLLMIQCSKHTCTKQWPGGLKPKSKSLVEGNWTINRFLSEESEQIFDKICFTVTLCTAKRLFSYIFVHCTCTAIYLLNFWWWFWLNVVLT